MGQGGQVIAEVVVGAVLVLLVVKAVNVTLLVVVVVPVIHGCSIEYIITRVHKEGRIVVVVLVIISKGAWKKFLI